MAKRIIIIIAVLAMVFTIAGCGNRKEEPSYTGGGVIFDPNQGDYVPPTPDSQVQNGVAIPGFGKLTIPPKTTDVTVDFYNPERNADKFYLTFEIRIYENPEDPANSEYESVYKSGFVEAGNHIQKIKLNRGFEAGEYVAHCFVQPYRADETLAPVNNAQFKFDLVVK